MNHPEIDIYCERIAAGFLNEPLNLFSNLLFIASGLLIVARKNRSFWPNHMFSYGIMIIMIGVASFLFHGFATKITMLGDVLAIAICVFYIIYLYLDKILLAKTKHKILVYGFLIVSGYITPILIPRDLTGGSSDYFSVWQVILLLCYLDKNPKRIITLQTLGLFTLSLTIRSFDQSICHIIPFGIHYIWHAINAYLLFHLSKRFYK